MSDTPIPYKRDSAAASVSADDVYRVGLLIEHVANCDCCRKAMIEAGEIDNNNNNSNSNSNKTEAWLAHEASQQPEAQRITTQPAKLGDERYNG